MKDQLIQYWMVIWNHPYAAKVGEMKQKLTLLFAFASRVLLSQQWGSGNIIIEEYRVQHPTEIYHFGNSSYLADASTQTI